MGIEMEPGFMDDIGFALIGKLDFASREIKDLSVDTQGLGGLEEDARVGVGDGHGHGSIIY